MNNEENFLTDCLTIFENLSSVWWFSPLGQYTPLLQKVFFKQLSNQISEKMTFSTNMLAFFQFHRYSSCYVLKNIGFSGCFTKQLNFHLFKLKKKQR